MSGADPLVLARRQLRRDRERTRAWPHLLDHKARRMRGSPFAFLRGSAPMFYDALAEDRGLRRGPAGEGWIVGDAHLENFGVFRTGSFRGESRRQVVFDLNDFDEAVVGPLRYDVLRLVTSLLLAARDRGIPAPESLAACDGLMRAHVRQLFEPRSRMPAVPAAVRELTDGVARRDRVRLLDDRTEIARGARRFVRGPRYLELPEDLRRRAAEAFARYLRRLPEAHRPDESQAEIRDMAFRVAGTGSLGCLRIAILVAGKGGRDGGWIFDMKEEPEPSAAILLGVPRTAPAKRVVQGIRACLAEPPRLVGTAKLEGRSMLVRRLVPQEDKLDPASLAPDTIGGIAAYCGALLGRAHRRGSRELPRKPWKRPEREAILEAAMRLAAIHEAAWLGYYWNPA